jgi:hypothetical protein
VAVFGHDDNHKNNDDAAPADQSTIQPDPQPDAVLDHDHAASLPSADSTSSLPFVQPQKPSGPPTADDKPADSSDENSLPPIGGNDDLVVIKQQALQQLSPLVSHLEQTPEEKFRTTMMMIQASDDEKLVKTAFEAAKEIKDDKVRAQALLDVINEINYFTQQPEN